METLPAHVSPELVRPYPFRDGRMTTDHPFDTVIPEVHRGPAAFYTLDGYHGMGPIWVFRRFKDVQAIYSDVEHFSSKDFAPFAQLEGGNWNLVPAESDPPVHTFHRQIANPLFTPKKMAAMEAQVRQIARDAIAKFKDKGECDFMAEMAFEFPIAVFLGLMDLPMENVRTFLDWENKLVHPKSLEEAREGTLLVIGFLREVIAERRKNPKGDLISYGITAEAGGRKFSEDELLGFCFNLFIGGLDTVSTNMGWQIRHLAEHPDHQALLRNNPSMIPAAMEEMLRRYAAVNTSRRCVKPVTIGGVQLMPGDVAALSTPLANNDAEEFPDPLTVRFDRNPRHITFGTGIHRCVGAPLARREMVIAMEEMLSTLPEFRVKPGAEVRSHVSAIVQLQNLPLVWKL